MDCPGIDDRRLWKRRRRRGPAKGAILPQVVTRPCLAVRLPLKGVREVMVRDQDGAAVASLQVR